MRKLIDWFRRDEEGVALVEYGMLLGLLALVCIVTVTNLGSEVSTVFSELVEELSTI
jgi:pilus assembly protein Flp/PilA